MAPQRKSPPGRAGGALSRTTQHLDFSTVAAAARYKWPKIWRAHGLAELPPPDRHVPCLNLTCAGRNRFRLIGAEIERGGWICGQGGNPTGGDGFDLLVHAGIARSKGEALRLVAAYLGIEAKPDPQATRRAREAARQREVAKLEEALVHELAILQQVVGARVAGRELARRHRALPPEWQPMPEGHWDRERAAAQRVAAMLLKLYPRDTRAAA